MAADRQVTLELILAAIDEGLRKSLGDAQGQLDRFGDSNEKLSKIDQSLAQLTTSAQGFGKALIGIVGLDIGAGLIQQMVSLADGFLNLKAKTEVAVSGFANTQDALAAIQATANATYSSLDATATLFQRISTSAKDLGLDLGAVDNIVRIFGQGLKISGATAAEADSAILQFSQALGAGALRGEEFNAVNEAAPRIMQALADGLGKPRGELKLLAEQGQLTADQIIKAVLSQKAVLEAEFAKLPLTIGSALTIAQNNLQIYIGTANEAIGVTTTIANTIKFFSESLEYLDKVLITIAAGGLAKVAASITGYIIQTRAAIAATNEQQAAAAAAARQTVATADAHLLAAQIVQQEAAARAIATKALLDNAIAEGYAAKQITAAKAQVIAANQAVTASVSKTEAAQASLLLAQEKLAATAATTGNALSRTVALFGGWPGVIMLTVGALVTLSSAFGTTTQSSEELSREIDEQIKKYDELTKNQLTALLQKQNELLNSDREAVALSAQKVAALEKETSIEKSSGEVNEVTLSTAREQQAIDKDLIAAKGDLDTAVQKLSDNTAKLGDTQKRLNDLTGAGAEGADKAAKSYVAIASELTQSANAADNFSSRLEALAGLQTASQQTTEKIIELLGTETQRRQQAAEAATLQVQRAEAIAIAKTNEADVAKLSFEALDKELAGLKLVLPVQQEQLDKLATTAVQKRAAAEQATAHATQLVIEAKAIQDMAAIYSDGALSLDKYRQQATAAREQLTQLTAAQQAGKATQEQVNQAQLEAVRAVAAYTAALQESLRQNEAAAAATQRRADIAEQEIQVEIDRNKALQDLLKVRGEEQAAAQIGIAIAELEVDQSEKRVTGLQAELKILQQRLALQKEQATASGEVTKAEQEQITALADQIIQKKLAIESAKANVDALEAEALASRQAAEATQEQADAQVQLDDSRSKARENYEKNRAAEEEETQRQNAAAQQIQEQARFYDLLTDAAKAAYTAQIQATTATLRSAEVAREFDRAASAELEWAGRTQAILDNLAQLGDQVYDSFGNITPVAQQAMRELQGLERESRAMGVAITDAGQQARASLRQYIDEAQRAQEEARALVQETTDTLLDELARLDAELGDSRAEAQREHEQKIARYKELGQVSEDAAKLAERAIAKEQERFNKEMQNIEQELTAKRQLNATEVEAKQVSEARQYFEDLNTVRLDGLQGVLATIEQAVDRLIGKTKTLRLEAEAL